MKLFIATKHQIREKLPKIYSQDLLNHLFEKPYTTAERLKTDLNIATSTALHYLNHLTEIGILQKTKIGQKMYYLHFQLLATLANPPALKTS